MPCRDSTGPEGMGPMTGRGEGYCTERYDYRSNFNPKKYFEPPYNRRTLCRYRRSSFTNRNTRNYGTRGRHGRRWNN